MRALKFPLFGDVWLARAEKVRLGVKGDFSADDARRGE